MSTPGPSRAYNGAGGWKAHTPYNIYMDTSQLPFAKGRPAALERQDRRTALKSRDEAENVKVRARSGGRCEMRFASDGGRFHADPRCNFRAAHIHHRIGGCGKRAHNSSVLADNKLHLCVECHSDIHAHVLVPDGSHFRRVR